LEQGRVEVEGWGRIGYISEVGVGQGEEGGLGVVCAMDEDLSFGYLRCGEEEAGTGESPSASVSWVNEVMYLEYLLLT
jgi:hypothetical protein